MRFKTLIATILALSIGLYALPTLARDGAPVSRSGAAAPKTKLVDLNSATAAELKPLPGVTDSDAAKIIQGRPGTDKHQLVSKKVPSLDVAYLDAGAVAKQWKEEQKRTGK